MSHPVSPTIAVFSDTGFRAPSNTQSLIKDWKFTFTPPYAYTLAGKVVGRDEYPATQPDDIFPSILQE